jgi:hypothetical protein
MEDKYRISFIHEDVYEVMEGDKQVYKGSIEECEGFLSLRRQYD